MFIVHIISDIILSYDLLSTCIRNYTYFWNYKYVILKLQDDKKEVINYFVLFVVVLFKYLFSAC